MEGKWYHPQYRKVCRNCESILTANKFYTGHKTNDGLSVDCKKCSSEKAKARYYKQKNETPERIKKNRKKFDKTPTGKYNIYKRGAKQRCIEFKLTKDEFNVFWKKPCSYCGDNVDYIGLDRIDNSKGYERENIISCCGLCNRMKGTLTVEEFISHCKKITEKE